jgi:CheY-like chemotaxis protein
LDAEDAPSALKVLEENGEDIDLVFSDVVMPSGMNGFELAQELRRRYPLIKVLLTSGYPEKVMDKGDTGVTLLRKPYKKADLAKEIRLALDQ